MEHFWRTRKDPFDDVWRGVEEKLKINLGLEAKTLFEDLQRWYPGRFGNGHPAASGQGLACTAGAPSGGILSSGAQAWAVTLRTGKSDDHQ